MVTDLRVVVEMIRLLGETQSIRNYLSSTRLPHSPILKPFLTISRRLSLARPHGDPEPMTGDNWIGQVPLSSQGASEDANLRTVSTFDRQ